MMDSHPKVLIVGAGLGGLVLAQALRRYGISFEIFERDHDQLSRSQGWAILLQWFVQSALIVRPLAHAFLGFSKI